MTAHPAKPLATTAPSPNRTAAPSRDACRQDRPNGRSSPHLPRATSFHCSPGARTLVSQIVRAQSMVVAVEEPPSAQPRAQGTPRLCIVGTPPERSRPPGQDRSDRSCFHPRSRHRGGGKLPRPGSGACIQTGPPKRFSPSALSSSSGLSTCARHHPSAHEERDTTALPCHRPAPAGFYSGHTPPLRGFNHRGVAAPAPETIPAPAEVPAFAVDFARPITLVAGVTRRTCRRTSDAPASAQLPCSRWSTLSRGRNQKLPSTRRRPAFPVRLRLRSNSPASP